MTHADATIENKMSYFDSFFSSERSTHSSDQLLAPKPLGYSHDDGSEWIRSLKNTLESRVLGDKTGATAENVGIGHNFYSRVEDQFKSRLESFFSYADGWDGDEAKEIPEKAIYAALNFLDEYKFSLSQKDPNSVAASPDGEVVIYWHAPDAYAEVNFDGEGIISLCWSDDDTDMDIIEEEYEQDHLLVKGGIRETLGEFLHKKF